MWKPLLWRFLGRVLAKVLCWHSATTFSVVRDIILVPAAILLVSLWWRVRKEKWWKWTVIKGLKNRGGEVLKAFALTVIGLCALFGIVFIAAVPVVVLQDHLDLVSANKVLKKENNDLKRKIEELEKHRAGEVPWTLQILYGNEPLDGRSLIVHQTSYPDAKGYEIALAPIEIRNPPQGQTVEGISMRLYFASKLTSVLGAPLSGIGPRAMLEPFENDEPAYSTTAYWGNTALRISIGETWTGPKLELYSEKQFSTDMHVMVKVFYGSSKPVIARFLVRGSEPQQVKP